MFSFIRIAMDIMSLTTIEALTKVRRQMMNKQMNFRSGVCGG